MPPGPESISGFLPVDLSIVKANIIKFGNWFHQFFSTHRQD